MTSVSTPAHSRGLRDHPNIAGPSRAVLRAQEGQGRLWTACPCRSCGRPQGPGVDSAAGGFRLCGAHAWYSCPWLGRTLRSVVRPTTRGATVTEDAAFGAFRAIHDEALKLLDYEVPSQVRAGLELIISISRYQADVRNEKERAAD